MIEKFLTLAEAAEHLGISYIKVQRAAKQGAFPRYSFQNGRILVRLTEVIASIETTSSEVLGNQHRNVNADDPVEYLAPPREIVEASPSMVHPQPAKERSR